jgi:DNA-binding transcriptional LysR family regulator
MHAIQITQLRAFVAVSALGSYTKAAESLGYSEPAVHLQVTALRRALGGVLFERHRGQIRLTRFGERMLPLAERIVEALDQLGEEADRFHAGEGQALVIGVGRSSGSYVMPAIAGLFRQVYPAVDVSVRMIPVTSIVGELIEGTIDIGFSGGLTEAVARERPRRPRVVAVPWSRYGWTFVAAPAYLAARDLCQETPLPVYLPAFGEPLQSRLVDAFPTAGVTPEFALVENSEAAKTAAQALLGVACIPVYAARLELATGELVRCLEEIEFPPAFIEFAHRRPVENPMVATFVAFLRTLRTHPSVRQILFPAGTASAAALVQYREASLRR